MSSSQVAGRHHALYRFYGHDDALLYVGITASLPGRLARHRGDKPWWSEVARISVEHFPDRQSVLRAETGAIRTERPRYNKQQNTQTATHRRRAVDTDFCPPLHLAKPIAALASDFASIPLEDPKRHWYYRRIHIHRHDLRVEITLDRDGYVDRCRNEGCELALPAAFRDVARRIIDAGIETLRRQGVADDLEESIIDERLPARWLTLHLPVQTTIHCVSALYEAEVLGDIGHLEWIEERLSFPLKRERHGSLNATRGTR